MCDYNVALKSRRLHHHHQQQLRFRPYDLFRYSHLTGGRPVSLLPSGGSQISSRNSIGWHS
jgi:hypothetical protein